MIRVLPIVSEAFFWDKAWKGLEINEHSPCQRAGASATIIFEGYNVEQAEHWKEKQALHIKHLINQIKCKLFFKKGTERKRYASKIWRKALKIYHLQLSFR